MNTYFFHIRYKEHTKLKDKFPTVQAKTYLAALHLVYTSPDVESATLLLLTTKNGEAIAHPETPGQYDEK